MANKKWLILVGLLLSSCGSNNNSTLSDNISVNKESSNNTISEQYNINDLINDSNANGFYDKTPNVNRYPEDELYDVILAKNAVLNVNEKYTEDFEKEDLFTRISPDNVEDGATVSLETSKNYSIDNKSLVIRSQGDYSGVIFGGMRFAKNSTYHIKMDYKIIKASNDFFFQFRSKTGGVETDIYEIISGDSGSEGTMDRVFFLDDYTDYQIMVFPRNLAGTLVIDNIEITRLNSKPRIINCEFEGSLTENSNLSCSYQYYDSENDLEVKTHKQWFVSLDNEGKNRELVAENVDQITINSSMIGKYVGVSLTPFSDSKDDYSIGNSYSFYSSEPVNNVGSNSGVTITLSTNQSFVEDFEKDTNVSGNIYFINQQNTSSYITSDDKYVINGYKSLYYKSNGDFADIRFDGIRFATNGIYQLKFKYKFLVKGNNFYVQLRTDSSSSEDDKFVSLDMATIDVGTVYEFNYIYSLNGFSDYYLMMFPSALGCEVVIDDLEIKRLEGYNVAVENVELAVGEKIIDDFNDMYSPKFAIDNSQTLNSKFTTDSEYVIDQRSLYIESDGNYHCLYINKGLTYTANATYKVEFDYKIISMIDTIYFQFNNGTSTIFQQFGNSNELNQVKHFSYEFTISAQTNYVIQIFPGQSIGLTKLIIDNLVIERTK